MTKCDVGVFPFFLILAGGGSLILGAGGESLTLADAERSDEAFTNGNTDCLEDSAMNVR